jgi:hypothetical protein
MHPFGEEAARARAESSRLNRLAFVRRVGGRPADATERILAGRFGRDVGGLVFFDAAFRVVY